MKIKRYPLNRPTRQLLPHQKDILRYMMNTNTPALFIDMRLGKTILTIEYAIRKGLKNVLVIAPMSTLNSWERELRVEGIRCCKAVGAKSTTLYKNILACPWVLTNPQKIARPKIPIGHRLMGGYKTEHWPFAKRKWDLIVIDESSRIKNPKSEYYKELMRNYAGIPHKILLSGTPTPENILEAVPQLIFLRGEVMGCRSYWEFLAKYTTKWGYDRYLYKGARAKLQTVLHDTCYFLSQKQAGVAQPARYVKILHSKNRKQKELIQQIRKDFELDLGGKHYETSYVLPTLMWACRIDGGMLDGNVINEAKYDSLKRIITGTSGQVVVWFRFNEELHYCERRLAEAGISVRAYYGDVSVADRKVLEEEFRAGKYQVLLLQVKTGLYALDLSAANVAVYYSNTWSLEERLQSEKRISHPKKKSTLVYYDLLFKGWPGTTIYNALRRKNISARMIWEAWDAKTW